MCCDCTDEMELPAEVIEMIARYRHLLRERPEDWGDDQIEMFRWARFSRLGHLLAAFAETGDWPAAVRAVIGDRPPSGVVLVGLTHDGLTVTVGSPRLAISDHVTPFDVVVDSLLDADCVVAIGAHTVRVPAQGVAVQTVDASSGLRIATETHSTTVSSAVRTAAAGWLQLRSPRCTRWSVVDTSGGAWFPDGVLQKWDVHHRPFFHAHDVTFRVPAGEELTVICARGLEYERIEQSVIATAGTSVTVDCDPPRRIDPIADGWYGGDLHIHMNYSGDLVCTPEDAARMQLGEGLQVANFVAGNCQTSLVYDRETLEQTVGSDLPWSSDERIARMGVEYRNDLLGHLHALGPSGLPTHYHAGHERSDNPYDWPPNEHVCTELRGLDATVGYPHPVFTPFPEDWSTDAFFANPRSVEARELLVDAPLGVVDCLDLMSPFNHDGAIFLYHRLLSCGLRIAATAGTDVFLSFSHGPGHASNPPGWCRVYANLGDTPLSIEAFKDAIRAGRTVVTNGPWLTFTVNDQPPGTVLALQPGDPLHIRAQVTGLHSGRLRIVGPEGTVAHTDTDLLELTTTLDQPTWLAARADGPGHVAILDKASLAHTSPVYIDIDGASVARRRDAHWCLDALNRFEQLLTEHGRFDPAHRADQLATYRQLTARARDYYEHIVHTASS
jgi:hypothetical protein